MRNKTTVFAQKTKSAIKQAYTSGSRSTVQQDSKFFTFNPKYYGSPILQENQNTLHSDIILDTLGHLTPNSLSISYEQNQENQKNEEIGQLSRKNLVKRARSKYHTLNLLEQLTSLGSENQTTYQRATECCNALKQDEQFLTSKYCKTRCCIVCNNIRTAELINRFKTPISSLGKTMFTTLTIPNVKWEILQQTIQTMIDQFREISKSIRKYYSIPEHPFSGVRRIEITYNSTTDTYHPHLHILHNSGYENILLEKWLSLNPTAKSWCQDTRETDQNTLTEIFKYSFKVVQGSKKKPEIYVSALDKIITASKSKRLVQPFGKLFNIKSEDKDLFNVTRQSYNDLPKNHFDIWYYQIQDWTNTGKPEPEWLTNYIPSDFKPNYII